MQHCYHLLVLFLCASFILASGAGAEIIQVTANGYIVETVSDDMDTGTPLETVSVEFWDLPPDFIIFILFTSFLSYLGMPVELLLIFKTCMLLGFRKISRKTVLSNETRSRIYSCITKNPGIIFSDLIRETGINRGSIAYHLNILEMTGKVSVFKNSGNPGYFENSGVYSVTEKTVLKYIRNDKGCRILRLLLEKPDLTRSDIVEHMGQSNSTIGWRMKRLRADELIRTTKNGRTVRYEINPDVNPYLEKHLVSGQGVSISNTDKKISESF